MSCWLQIRLDFTKVSKLNIKSLIHQPWWLANGTRGTSTSKPLVKRTHWLCRTGIAGWWSWWLQHNHCRSWHAHMAGIHTQPPSHSKFDITSLTDQPIPVMHNSKSNESCIAYTIPHHYCYCCCRCCCCCYYYYCQMNLLKKTQQDCLVGSQWAGMIKYS